MPEPFSTVCRNPGYANRFTTPCCYADIAANDDSTHRCPKCGREVHCTVDYQPVAVCRLVEDDD